MAVQVVEDSLIRHLPTIFSIDDVLDLSEDRYAELVGESQEDFKLRRSLNSKISALKRSKTTFEELIKEA